MNHGLDTMNNVKMKNGGCSGDLRTIIAKILRTLLSIVIATKVFASLHILDSVIILFGHTSDLDKLG